MAKTSYSNLKLKINTSTKSFDYNGNSIEVLQYLPIKDKYALIMMTLHNASENNIYNPVLLDMYFHLGLVYVYSNLNITDSQKTDEFKLYDNLNSNEIITKIIELIPETEYNLLYNYIQELKEENLNYKHTAVALLKSLAEDLPKSVEAAMASIKDFDKEKYADVMNFIKSANGGREI